MIRHSQKTAYARRNGRFAIHATLGGTLYITQEQRIVFVMKFRCAEQFYVPNMQKQSKTGKNPEINRHRLSFDGINQENINLSDIY